MSALGESARVVVGLLVTEEWELLGRLTEGSRMSVDDIRAVVDGYGRTLVLPPPKVYDELDAIEVRNAPKRTFNIRFPLWTEEEGRSDLELVLTAVDFAEGLWTIHVDSVLVP